MRLSYRRGILCTALGVFSSLSAQNADTGFSIIHRQEQTQVDVLYDGQLITSYCYPDTLDKPILFPFRTLDGMDITRGYPLAPRANERIDHPHQVGVWFNFGDVNGLDFWNNSYAIPAEKKPHYGSIRHQSFREIEAKADHARLSITAHWVDNHGKILLKEETDYLFIREGEFLSMEHRSRLEAMADSVVFKDNKEGLFAIRVAREFEERTDQADYFILPEGNVSETKIVNPGNANGVYLNSEGDTGEAAWGKQAAWVVLSARKNNKPISIALFDHPDNPGYPACFHARGYGLFSVNNLGKKAFDPQLKAVQYTLKKGESLYFKHKLSLKPGEFASLEELTELVRLFR